MDLPFACLLLTLCAACDARGAYEREAYYRDPYAAYDYGAAAAYDTRWVAGSVGSLNNAATRHARHPPCTSPLLLVY